MTISEKLGILYALCDCDICENCMARNLCKQGKEVKLNFIREVQADVNSILEQLPKVKEET